MKPDPLARMRSVLFAPAIRDDMIPKLARAGADAVIIDCEDATPLGQKAAGRLNALELAPALIADGQQVFVRVNALGTDWFVDDVRFGLAEGLAGVVVPMVEDMEQLDRCAKVLAESDFGHLGIVAGLETGLGVADARTLLTHPQVVGAYFGAEDYVADLGGQRTDTNVEVHYARSVIVQASRLARKPVFDQVVANFRDSDRFVRETAEARAMGFDGKLCIHPGQVELANNGFTPNEAEVERAERLLAAFDIGVASGVAAIDFEGQMVDEPVAEQARQILKAGGVDPRGNTLG